MCFTEEQRPGAILPRTLERGRGDELLRMRVLRAADPEAVLRILRRCPTMKIALAPGFWYEVLAD